MGSLSPLLKYLRLPSQITSPLFFNFQSHHQQPAGLLLHHVIVTFSPPQQLKSLLLLLWTLYFVPFMDLSLLKEKMVPVWNSACRLLCVSYVLSVLVLFSSLLVHRVSLLRVYEREFLLSLRKSDVVAYIYAFSRRFYPKRLTVHYTWL